MAQIDFFLCKSERVELVEFILSKGLLLVPDLAYQVAKPIIMSDIEEYKTYAYSNILLFLINSKDDVKHFDYGSFQKEGESKLYIRQRYGLPNIHFLSYGLVENTEKRIAPSSISNYPFYYGKKNEKIYPVEKDKLIYKELSSFIKRLAVPAKFTKRTYFIGMQTISLYNSKNYKLLNIGDVNTIDLIDNCR